MRAITKLGSGLLFCATAAAVLAATALKYAGEINVSQTLSATEKAKAVRLSYLDGSTFRKAWLYTYGDGPADQQNIYARYSFDDAQTWSAPLLLSRDAANMPTGGIRITAMNANSYVAENDKPSIFAPPVTSGPKVLITWNSSYCPQTPAAANNSGSYTSSVQGVGDANGDGTLDRPFHCVWVASTTDAKLAAWDVQQLTNGQRDAINEVASGSSTGNAFALAWQEDPAGLQPGEAEGRGDGGMGSHATGGTNIWYTYAPTLSGSTLRTNVAQLSDNNTQGTGQAGASRPNLQISGSTAVLAYEETACPGGNTGKCIVHHAFPYNANDINSPGTIISDVTKNSRRVRFVLQGASGAGSSNLRSVVLWRESASTVPAAPADIVVRRGFVDTAARPGSNGFLSSDILADTQQYMTNTSAAGGNANAHRAIVRGSFVGVAYNQTPSMDAADPEKTAVPSANYNLFFTRSAADGSPGSWSSAANLSGIDSPTMSVVEPRLVPTPATVVNPLTGVPDAGDTQDPNVLYLAYATQSNTLAGNAGRVYVSRSVDQGASFQPFVPVSPALSGQSESQLRPTPDGASTIALWMGEQTPGNAQSKDAMFAALKVIDIPDLNLKASGAAFTVGGQQTLNLAVQNRGVGHANKVLLKGALPEGLRLVGISDPSSCAVSGTSFSCAIATIAPEQTSTVTLNIGSASEGSYALSLDVSSEDPDANLLDNTALAAVSVTAPGTTSDVVTSPDGTSTLSSTGGGCTTARPGAPVDPSLPLLAGLAALGLALRRLRPGK